MENGGNVYDMPSGAKLRVSVSEFEKVMHLHDAIADALRGGGAGSIDAVAIQKAFDANVAARVAKAKGQPWEDDGSGDGGLNEIVDRVIALVGSRTVKAAVFACADKALYMPDGTEASAVHFQPGSAGYGVFDNPKCMTAARGDFYEICRAIAEENLRPFGKALFSMFKDHVGSSAATPA